MNKDTKKFMIAGFLGLATFIMFAFSFIFVKMKQYSTWWSGLKTSGYKLIGEIDNFGGFLTNLFSVLILVGAGLIIVLSIFGILNSKGKAKIKFSKLKVDVLLKWVLFIVLCATLFNVFWVLINVGTLNGKFSGRDYKYVISIIPFLILLLNAVHYCCYCLLDGKFIWMPKFWEKKNKQPSLTKTNEDQKSELPPMQKDEEKELEEKVQVIETPNVNNEDIVDKKSKKSKKE